MQCPSYRRDHRYHIRQVAERNVTRSANRDQGGENTSTPLSGPVGAERKYR